MKCDVCHKPIHLESYEDRFGNKKKRATACPYEPYKFVKYFYTPEFRALAKDIYLSNDPEDIKAFSEKVPKETELFDYVSLYDNNVGFENLFIESNIDNFFLEFNRVLINLYVKKKIRFIDSIYTPGKDQVNYLWLSPMTLKECYFKDGLNNNRLKNMGDLLNPSLVIYPMGMIQSSQLKVWPEVFTTFLTSRLGAGKPTWIVSVTPYLNSLEYNSQVSNILKDFKTISSTNIEIQISKEDEEDNKEIFKKIKQGKKINPFDDKLGI